MPSMPSRAHGARGVALVSWQCMAGHSEGILLDRWLIEQDGLVLRLRYDGSFPAGIEGSARSYVVLRHMAVSQHLSDAFSERWQHVGVS